MIALQMQGSGRTEDALEVLTTIEGGGAHLDSTRAMLARKAGDAVAAERYARSACLADPELAVAWGELGKALEAQGRLDAAEEAFRAARARDTSSGDPIAALGRIAEARGQRDRARSLYSEAANARNGTDEAHWRLAALLIEDLEVEEADAELALLAAETILEPEAAVRLARAEAAAGLAERARQRLEAAREKSPDSALLDETFAELVPGR